MKKFGVMVDSSRNAVRTISTLKKYLHYLKKCNMNCLYLYMEDIFELEGEPFFGYFRGRYTSEELKELDDYAYSLGITLTPCIQTLAHLNQIFRWKPYQSINDINDTLLCDDEKTYALIEKMFEFVSKTFRTKSINIGMDEAFLLGRGKYLSLHGHKNKVQIFFRHLSRVYEMANKYNFEISIWSDMIYRSVAHSEEYYNTNLHFDLNTIPSFSSKINLIYWDYYHVDIKTYNKMFESHLEFPNKIIFAGGAWSWTGFVPSLRKAFTTLKPGILSAKNHNIDEIFITLWGDNGAECPLFATLAPVFFASEIYHGVTSLKDIKKHFYETFDLKYEDFAKLELPNLLSNREDTMANPSKYLLYNDPFMGICDSTILDGETAIYLKYSKALNKIGKNMKEFSYIAKMYSSLCKALYYKAELGLKTRKAYKNKDKEGLKNLLSDYSNSIKYIKVFLNDFRKAWFSENKPNGFEVQEIRIGGLITRIESCKNRIVSYLNNEITSIPELEEDVIDVEGNEKLNKKTINVNNHLFNASVNIF